MNITKSLLFRISLVILVIYFVWKVALIPFKIQIIFTRFPQPQSIFVLGGNNNREIFAAQFAQNKPELDIWISSPSQSKTERVKVDNILAKLNIDSKRVHIDSEATDTVSNFTTLLDDFRKKEIHHIYLITSANHMARARLIGTIIFGSNNIVLTPVALNDEEKAESSIKLVRDLIRSIIYLLTGIY